MSYATRLTELDTLLSTLPVGNYVILRPHQTALSYRRLTDLDYPVEEVLEFVIRIPVAVLVNSITDIQRVLSAMTNLVSLILVGDASQPDLPFKLAAGPLRVGLFNLRLPELPPLPELESLVLVQSQVGRLLPQPDLVELALLRSELEHWTPQPKLTHAMLVASRTLVVPKQPELVLLRVIASQVATIASQPKLRALESEGVYAHRHYPSLVRLSLVGNHSRYYPQAPRLQTLTVQDSALLQLMTGPGEPVARYQAVLAAYPQLRYSQRE